ncbi:TerD family protein [Streptomyces sp. NPDC056943]|uniref:TerD family protein n=1 Tax=Streptomyces sp. NPDC056943 TaxID=3345971 RepID=UPI003629425D
MTDVLPRGGVIDLPTLPTASPWHVSASWAQQTNCEVDVVAFVLDEDEQVSCDGDFVFYSAPESPDGATRLLCDGPTEQTIAVDLAALPPAAHRIAIAAAIDGAADPATAEPLTFARWCYADDDTSLLPAVHAAMTTDGRYRIQSLIIDPDSKTQFMLDRLLPA